MMQELKGRTGEVSLSDIPVPPVEETGFYVEDYNKVIIKGVSDEYYGLLNDDEPLLWSGGGLKRRRFDFQGNFMRDKDGKLMFIDVPVPHECIAVISDKNINVPLKHKVADTGHFEYVDYVERKATGERKYIYIIPRQYCYKLNQTALVLSWTSLRNFLDGIELSLTNGHRLYMYVIMYKPTTAQHNYRVLHCKTSNDYRQEVDMLVQFWQQCGVLFDFESCALAEPVNGVENMAYKHIDSPMDTYIRFNPEKSLAKTSEEMDFGYEDALTDTDNEDI